MRLGEGVDGFLKLLQHCVGGFFAGEDLRELLDLSSALGGRERAAKFADEHVLLDEELLVVVARLAAEDDEIAVEQLAEGVDLRVHVANDFGNAGFHFLVYEVVAEGFEGCADDVGLLGGDGDSRGEGSRCGVGSGWVEGIAHLSEVGSDGGGGCIELVRLDIIGDVREGLSVGLEAVEDVGAGFEAFGVDEVLDGVRVPGLVGVVLLDDGGDLLVVVDADCDAIGVLRVIDYDVGGCGEGCSVSGQRRGCRAAGEEEHQRQG